MLEQVSRQVRRAMERAKKNEQLRKEKHGIDSSGNISPQRWIPSDEIVEVAGRRISGMVYFGIPVNYICTCGNLHKSGVCIDPTRIVAKKGDSSDDFNLNTHSYQKMGRNCRANYLDWLAGGKTNPNCSIYYPISYFWGLERRFMFDNPSAEEKEEILTEVTRLQNCFHNNAQFNKYVAHFMQFADGVSDLSKIFDVSHRHIFEDELVNRIISIGNRDTTEIIIDVEDALAMHELVLRKTYPSCKVQNPPMFYQLFRLRFTQEYPNGFVANRPTKFIDGNYVAGSHEFTKTIDFTYQKKPLFEFSEWVFDETPVRDLMVAIYNELNDHTDFTDENPSMLGSPEAMALLPLELRNNDYLEEANTDQTLLKLRSWAQAKAKLGSMVRVEDAVNQAIGWVSKDIVSNSQWKEIEKKFAMCGFGIAPDFNLWLRQPTPDDPVAIYKFAGKDRKKLRLTKNYKTVLTQIALGAYLFQLEKRSTEEAQRWLTAHLAETKCLTIDERASLAANIDCVLAKPHDKTYLQRLRSAVKEYDKEALRAVAVKFANSDNVVRADSVSVVEQIYSALGFEPKMAYSDLHAGEIVTNEPGVKRDDSKASELNEDRIKSIRSDTERVSKVLGDIFVDEEDEKTKPVEDQKILVSGLDSKHAYFLKSLMEKEHWTEDAFGDLAKEFGLLPVGALETINEWVFDRYEEPLVDENDGFHLIPAVTKTLKAELEGMQAA